MSQVTDIAFPQTHIDPAPEDRTRSAAVILAFVALAVSCVLATYLEFKTHSAHLAMSNLPLVVLIPFVVGLTINFLLKRFIPAYSLTSAELRILLSVLWVGGSFAGYNWATQWVGTMAAPRYYASPENRWMELIFDYLPWWMYPTNLEGVEEQFYLGTHQQAFPWTAWIGPTFWACAAGVAMTSIAIGVTALFQRHWADHERLTYPLAEVPLALTDGFNQQRGWPPFTRERVFWIGFAVAAFPVLWNMRVDRSLLDQSLRRHEVCGCKRVRLHLSQMGGHNNPHDLDRNDRPERVIARRDGRRQLAASRGLETAPRSPPRRTNDRAEKHSDASDRCGDIDGTCRWRLLHDPALLS